MEIESSPKKSNTTEATPYRRRFYAGDNVRIVPVIATRHAGSIGKIKAAKYNSRDRITLDKYLVEFEDGFQAWFWSIQLEPNMPLLEM
jgi:hypothetical protein